MDPVPSPRNRMVQEPVTESELWLEPGHEPNECESEQERTMGGVNTSMKTRDNKHVQPICTEDDATRPLTEAPTSMFLPTGVNDENNSFPQEGGTDKNSDVRIKIEACEDSNGLFILSQAVSMVQNDAITQGEGSFDDYELKLEIDEESIKQEQSADGDQIPHWLPSPDSDQSTFLEADHVKRADNSEMEGHFEAAGSIKPEVGMATNNEDNPLDTARILAIIARATEVIRQREEQGFVYRSHEAGGSNKRNSRKSELPSQRRPKAPQRRLLPKPYPETVQPVLDTAIAPEAPRRPAPGPASDLASTSVHPLQSPVHMPEPTPPPELAHPSELFPPSAQEPPQPDFQEPPSFVPFSSLPGFRPRPFRAPSHGPSTTAASQTLNAVYFQSSWQEFLTADHSLDIPVETNLDEGDPTVEIKEKSTTKKRKRSKKAKQGKNNNSSSKKVSNDDQQVEEDVRHRGTLPSEKVSDALEEGYLPTHTDKRLRDLDAPTACSSTGSLDVQPSEKAYTLHGIRYVKRPKRVDVIGEEERARQQNAMRIPNIPLYKMFQAQERRVQKRGCRKWNTTYSLQAQLAIPASAIETSIKLERHPPIVQSSETASTGTEEDRKNGDENGKEVEENDGDDDDDHLKEEREEEEDEGHDDRDRVDDLLRDPMRLLTFFRTRALPASSLSSSSTTTASSTNSSTSSTSSIKSDDTLVDNASNSANDKISIQLRVWQVLRLMDIVPYFSKVEGIQWRVVAKGLSLKDSRTGRLLQGADLRACWEQMRTQQVNYAREWHPREYQLLDQGIARYGTGQRGFRLIRENLLMGRGVLAIRHRWLLLRKARGDHVRTPTRWRNVTPPRESLKSLHHIRRTLQLRMIE
ncbi:hypothetical protein DFQ27_006098 [Actinomortierella ambigua]|uniref:Uncharacterized protein n=1 Tax=Actinomortierella ambigua TaxID=1343610 RepID=A0A9P6U0Y2_9FUNG|nr:hypothetical protein DFQ27_006098 [Actinomortierella ambigua]